MKKYAKVVNEETKLCEVGLDTNISYYESIGMTEQEVEQTYDDDWYLLGYAPEPTKEEISILREQAYIQNVDKITCHINRLKDEEQTPEVIAEIASLVEERKAKVEEIKQRYPYPEETTPVDSENNELEEENIIEEIGEDKESEDLTSE